VDTGLPMNDGKECKAFWEMITYGELDCIERPHL